MGIFVSCEGKLLIDFAEEKDGGKIFKMEIVTDEELFGQEIVYFYVTDDEISIIPEGEDIFGHYGLVCADGERDLSEDKLKITITHDGDICTYRLSNERVEAGLYQQIIFEKMWVLQGMFAGLGRCVTILRLI